MWRNDVISDLLVPPSSHVVVVLNVNAATPASPLIASMVWISRSTSTPLRSVVAAIAPPFLRTVVRRPPSPDEDGEPARAIAFPRGCNKFGRGLVFQGGWSHRASEGGNRAGAGRGPRGIRGPRAGEPAAPLLPRPATGRRRGGGSGAGVLIECVPLVRVAARARRGPEVAPVHPGERLSRPAPQGRTNSAGGRSGRHRGLLAVPHDRRR